MLNSMFIEDILPRGDYATEQLCSDPTGDVAGEEDDLLKKLGREYMRYLLLQQQGSAGENKKTMVVKRDQSGGFLPADSGRTVTEYLLGQGRLIERFLDEHTGDLMAEDELFHPPAKELLLLLSPVPLPEVRAKNNAQAKLVDLLSAGVDSRI